MNALDRQPPERRTRIDVDSDQDVVEVADGQRLAANAAKGALLGEQGFEFGFGEVQRKTPPAVGFQLDGGQRLKVGASFMLSLLAHRV